MGESPGIKRINPGPAPGGWLTTVVSRICLDMLQTRKSRHEESMEAYSPHAVMNHPHSDPEGEALLGAA
ncbi:hypothetical protein FE782_26060 [Paenibacillus antri]|uniref:Uncharacterized protein n=1 Tax=Paenibacillus antri TaxID=2582848 RepID=A0A5R9G0M0_9BACL|nr:hypothetical protein [Paenibacillus antri]TLS49321.1 hypothetical protein FE782_26060 [Paenibacillus antri]